MKLSYVKPPFTPSPWQEFVDAGPEPHYRVKTSRWSRHWRLKMIAALLGALLIASVPLRAGDSALGMVLAIAFVLTAPFLVAAFEILRDLENHIFELEDFMKEMNEAWLIMQRRPHGKEKMPDWPVYAVDLDEDEEVYRMFEFVKTADGAKYRVLYTLVPDDNLLVAREQGAELAAFAVHLEELAAAQWEDEHYHQKVQQQIDDEAQLLAELQEETRNHVLNQAIS
jgi:hypothetical protein